MNLAQVNFLRRCYEGDIEIEFQCSIHGDKYSNSLHTSVNTKYNFKVHCSFYVTYWDFKLLDQIHYRVLCHFQCFSCLFARCCQWLFDWVADETVVTYSESTFVHEKDVFVRVTEKIGFKDVRAVALLKSPT